LTGRVPKIKTWQTEEVCVRTHILIVLFAAVAVSGCTSAEKPVYGNETQVSYENGIPSEKVKTVHSSIREVSWDGNASLEKLNSTSYRVNITTGRPDERRTVRERYSVQRTITMIKAGEFSRQETVILNLKSRNGRTLSKFIQ
jgi:hypothetical protein